MNKLMEKAIWLSGQVAQVAGGGSGLRYANATWLAAAGATVISSGREESALEEA